MEATQEIVDELIKKWSSVLHTEYPEGRYFFPFCSPDGEEWRFYSAVVLNDDFKRVETEDPDGRDNKALNSIELSQELLESLHGWDMAFDAKTALPIYYENAAYREVFGPSPVF